METASTEKRAAAAQPLDAYINFFVPALTKHALLAQAEAEARSLSSLMRVICFDWVKRQNANAS